MFQIMLKLVCVAHLTCALDLMYRSVRQMRQLQPETHDHSGKREVTILRWSAFGKKDLEFNCPRSRCFVTSKRSILHNASALYWSVGNGELMLKDMPSTRPAGQLWALEMNESPCIYDLVRSSSVLSYFNIGIGMSPQADVERCPYVPQRFLTALQAPAMPTAEKDSFRRKGTGLVAYIQSNCIPVRDSFVDALEAEGIQVDALGECRRNGHLPPGLDRRSTLDSGEFLGFERRYKFAIALENCKCQDYVTEKLFRRLHEGVVPIYDPGSEDWLPSASAIINPSKFSSVRQLALELKRLDANNTAYEELLAWKHDNLEHTQLTKRLKRCTNTYKGVSPKEDPSDWCPICDAVDEQQADMSSVSSLAERAPFGVCPGSKSLKVKESEELQEFLNTNASTVVKFARPNSTAGKMSPLEQPLPASLRMWKRVHGPWMKAEAAKGFPSRPKRSSWSDLLRRSAEGASADPCTADVLLGAFNWPFGFGSRFNNVVNGIWSAMYQNLSVAACDSPWAEAVWVKHFDNVVNIPVCKSCPSSLAMQEAFLMSCFGGGPAQQLANVDRAYITDLKRFIYTSLFKYNNETQLTVNEKVAELKLGKGTRYLGVHIRHGDKVKEADLVPIDKYVAQVRNFLGKGNASSVQALYQLEEETLTDLTGKIRTELKRAPAGLRVVYIASDDPTIRKKLQQRLGPDVDVREQARLDDASYNSSSVGQSEAATVNLLTDIDILRNAEVFIGTASSNLGRLIFFLRESKRRSISLDDQGDFLHRPC